MRLCAALVLAVLAAATPAEGATVELAHLRTLPGSPADRYASAYPPTDVLELRVTAAPGDADDLRIDGLRVSGTTPPTAGARCRADDASAVVLRGGRLGDATRRRRERARGSG